jgi:plastocyanin
MKRCMLTSAAGLAVLATLALSQGNPGPVVDRIGFPTDYQTKMRVLYVFDRPDVRQVRTIYGNDQAASVDYGKGLTYPYGSVMVMETHAALTDANGPVLDANGRFQKSPAATPTLFVMKKERGFGVEYGPNRNGEWEYVAYRPDGTYQTTPQNSASCAVCHLQAGATPDWTFRVLPLYVRGNSGINVDGIIKDYKFIPGTLTVKVGSTVTFHNDDLIEHTITDRVAGGGDSGLIGAGKSLSVKFTEVGEFNFRCRLHANMTGRVIVER